MGTVRVDRHVSPLLLAAERDLGDGLRSVTVVEVRGERHIWADCPIGGDDEHMVLNIPGTRVYQISASEMYQIHDCPFCTAQLRPGAGVDRWLARQLAPYATATQSSDPGEALASCLPNGIITSTAVVPMLSLVRERFSLSPRLEGPVTVVRRDGVDPGRLPAGVHAAPCDSVVPALPGEETLGEIPPGRDGAAAAEVFLALRGDTPLSDQGLWQTALDAAS